MLETQQKNKPIHKHYRACHLCEAICGVEITVQDKIIISIKGDKQDPISRGYICPKAVALKDLHEDADRLRQPVKRIKTAEGDQWQPISWEDAYQLIAEKLCAIQEDYGNDAVAFYAGNPSVHNYGNLTHGPLLRRVLKTRNNYSATSLDQLPHQLVGMAMYGHQFLLPIADIDHTDFMLILGANPIASNGSLMTVPDVGKRLKAIKQRGGKVIVIDPRHTETAAIASKHWFIKPGTDAYLLMAMINTLFAKNWVDVTHTQNHLKGLPQVREAAKEFTPELAARICGISAADIVELTAQFSRSKKAVCYGRMGVSVQQFGTVCQWAIQLLNILTNNLDVRGGALPTAPAFGYIAPESSKGRGHFAQFHSRVSGLPEFSGELPTVALAEEITTEGEGQIKALVTIAGNPVLSAPNGVAIDKALQQLDFMLAIDFYINATTRHADVILPPTSPLEHDHYDIAFLRLAVHNSARYNQALFEPEDDSRHEWQIFNQLSSKIASIKGIDFEPLPAPHQIIDWGIQSGHYGKQSEGLDLERLKAHPHGVDLGALQPSLLDRLCTEDKHIQLAPDFLIEDLKRLQKAAPTLQEVDKQQLKLIGRRHVRSNNSWMHNFTRLVKGKPRWKLLMHPEDMSQRSLEDDQQVTIKSRVGSVQTQVISSEEMMPGVVSLPHGWGHHTKGREQGIKMEIALKQQGVSANDLCDDKFYDTLTGNAAFNAVEVTVESVS